jgi:hypothetical protein
MQDQQQWAAGRMQGPPGSYPSQPGAPPQQYPQQQIPQGQQGIAEFQDQFNKFAESMYLLSFLPANMLIFSLQPERRQLEVS